MTGEEIENSENPTEKIEEHQNAVAEFSEI